jgi:hypothetical protein
MLAIGQDDAEIILSDYTNTAYLKYGNKRLGIDGTGFFKSVDGGSSKTYF